MARMLLGFLVAAAFLPGADAIRQAGDSGSLERGADVSSVPLAARVVGPHQCQIDWQVNSATAVASFGVAECSACAAGGDYNYDQVFAEAFLPEDERENANAHIETMCVCNDRTTGFNLVSLAHHCDTGHEARLKCFEKYAILRTNSYVKLPIQSRPELRSGDKFVYECHENACPPEGCAHQVTLPTIAQGMEEAERLQMMPMVKRWFEQHMPTAAEQEALGLLTLDDRAEFLYMEVSPNREPMQVSLFKRLFEAQFKGDPALVTHTLNGCDLISGKQTIDLSAFVWFVRMWSLVKLRKQGLTLEESAPILWERLHEISQLKTLPRDRYSVGVIGDSGGDTIKSHLLGETYTAWMEGAEVDVAGIGEATGVIPAADSLDVTLADYLRFRHALRAVRRSSHVVPSDVQGASSSNQASSAADEVSEGSVVEDAEEPGVEKRYHDLAPDGGLTVGQLRRIYTALLKGTGINVTAMIRAAHFCADEEPVTLEKFRRFLNPQACEWW